MVPPEALLCVLYRTSLAVRFRHGNASGGHIFDTAYVRSRTDGGLPVTQVVPRLFGLWAVRRIVHCPGRAPLPVCLAGLVLARSPYRWRRVDSHSSGRSVPHGQEETSEEEGVAAQRSTAFGKPRGARAPTPDPWVSHPVGDEGNHSRRRSEAGVHRRGEREDASATSFRYEARRPRRWRDVSLRKYAAVDTRLRVDARPRCCNVRQRTDEVGGRRYSCCGRSYRSQSSCSRWGAGSAAW